MVGWLALGVPLLVAIAMMISVGPYLQKSIFSALNSDAPDIYTSAYEDSISRFPPLLDWLTAAFHWFFLILAGALAVISLRAKSLQNAMILVAIWSAILLTLGDALGALLSRKIEVPTFIANITANMAGGMLIALLTGSALALYRWATTSLMLSRTYSLSIGALILVAFGAAVSTVTYLGLRGLYHPLPVNVSVLISPPTKGFFGTKARSGHRSDETGSAEFTFLPRRSVRGGVHITSPEGAVVAKLHRSSGSRQYDMEIRFLGDCGLDRISEMLKGPASLLKRDAKSALVTFDEGFAIVEVISGPSRNFAFGNAGPTMFWLARNAEGLRVTQWGTASDQLSVGSWDKIEFLVRAPLFGKQGAAIAPIPRTITVEVDGEKRRWLFQRSDADVSSTKLECRSITSALPKDDSVEQVVVNGSEVAALVTITPTASKLAHPVEPEVTLTIQGANGWVSMTDLPTDEWMGVGRISALMVEGAVPDFEVNSVRVEVKSYDDIVMHGDLRGELIKGGDVKVSGKATALWKSSKRLNPTRWESLPSEWQLALLAAFASFLTFMMGMIKWLWPQIKSLANEDPKSWVA